jgi:hypothetical protein
MKLHLGLVHYPVYNKEGKTIASAITVADLHDISRAAKTYGVSRFFVINPLTDQRNLAEKVKAHWTSGFGAQYNKDRKEALELMSVVESVDEAVTDIESIEKEAPAIVATDASRHEATPLSYGDARRLVNDDRVLFLLFGTGWGLDRSLLKKAQYILEPVMGRSSYNHLSVRSAAAIILDRIAG